MSRNITIYICIWCNKYIISNGNIAYYDSVYSNPNAITNRRYTFPFTTIFLPYGYTFVQITIFSYNCILIDCYIIWMPQVQSLPHFYAIAELNAISLLKMLISKSII